MKKTEQGMIPLEIEHVCIVVRDRGKAMQRFSALTGAGFSRVFDVVHSEGIVYGKKTHFEGKLAFAQVGPTEIELIEPVKGESIWGEFLRTKGEGVHHLGIFVPDLDKELARFEELGIGVLQYGEGPDRPNPSPEATKSISGGFVRTMATLNPCKTTPDLLPLQSK